MCAWRRFRGWRLDPVRTWFRRWTAKLTMRCEQVCESEDDYPAAGPCASVLGQVTREDGLMRSSFRVSVGGWEFV